MLSQVPKLVVLVLGMGWMGAVMVSCKKKAPADTTLVLRITPVAGSVPLDFETAYPYKSGYVKFEAVRFYISLPGVVYEKGDTLIFPDVYGLLDMDNDRVVVGKIPPGRYSHVTFGMGVDRERNTQMGSLAQPATQYPMDHALSAAHGMYWGWNPGYIFARFDGRYDVDGNGYFTDSVDVLFSYHPGTDKLYRTIYRPAVFSAEGGQVTLSLRMDVLKCLEPLDIPAHPAAHPVSPLDPEYPTAQLFVDQYELAFSGVDVQ